MSPITIILDRQDPVYSAGENVSGKAIIVLDSALWVREVKISFIGEAHVSWRRSRHRYTDNEEIFNKTMKLWPSDGGPNQKSSTDVVMPGGEYEFNFSFPIPKKTPTGLNLSHGISDTSGYIRYFLEVRIVRPAFYLDHQTHREYVSIMEVYDLNTNSLASEPIAITDGKTICSLCCASGRIDVSINLPKTGYAIGEYLALSVEIANHSTRIVKEVRLQLFQICEFRIHSGHSHVVENSVIANMIKDEPVLPGQSMRWENEGFPIPSFTRPSMSAEVCRIIEYRHHLLFQLVPSGLSFNFNIRIPVLIGTIPLWTPAPDPRSIVKFKRKSVSKEAGSEDVMRALTKGM